MEIAVICIAVVMAILMLLMGVRGMQTGVIEWRSGPTRRDESPIAFWILIAGYFAAALVVMPIMIRKVLWGM